jgi:hypothetical protein
MANENGICNATINIHKVYYSKKKLHDSLKLPNLRPGQYILMQKAAVFNTCPIARKFVE